MFEELKDKTFIVTGGTTGIGKKTVETLAQIGANVCFCSRSEEAGKQLAADLNDIAEGRIIFIAADASSESSMAQFIAFSVSEFGRIDYAINNAGIRGQVAPLHLCQSADWDQMIDINLKGVFLSLKYEITQMLAQREQDIKSGVNNDMAIVNISSVYGTGGSALGLAPYHAAKHGVIGLTTTAATEYAANGIRVNAVCPGWVDIEATEQIDKDFMSQVEKYHPMQRIGKTEEIAKSILFLCTSASGFTTGHSLMVDGGISAKRDGGLL